ncbi:MAG: hypothetical protein DI582_03815 [Azospirillum brasilense]|nr:MAG: hypothetical protein DI582_03815 [Azospirillum brasilense]
MRYIESDKNNPSQMDFVPRERRKQVWNVIMAFSIAIALIFILSFAPGVVGGRAVAGFISMGVVSVLCFYVVFHKQQNLDLVMSTEYQNMLFAQAAALGSSFCIFAKRNGTIVYANDGLRDLFPHIAYSDSQALEGLFEQGGVRKTDRERIMASIYSGTADRIVFPIRQRDGNEQDYILTTEPLLRPGGFMVIRGREYRDSRAGTQLMPDVLRSTSADKLDHMLATTPVAHYATDAYGRFEYVNPALETLLGYEGGEMLESKLAIYHILYQIDGQPVSEDYSLVEYQGDALFQKKQGSLANAVFHQAILRDEQGKVLGATGSILPHPGR